MTSNSSPCPCSADLFADARALGFCGVKAAAVEPVDTSAWQLLCRWLADGHNASMAYLERYTDVRRNPALLLPDAAPASILMLAMSYRQPDTFSPTPPIASYARGDDYHEVVRARLESLAAIVRERFGGATRCCVDTAPLMERYWAVRSGLAFRALNGCVIVPGYGSTVFLGAIITTVRFAADSPLDIDCGSCRRCIAACPGQALRGDGTLDARRCLSYLTIEHRGDFPAGTDLHGCLYGCDTCQRVCPHNALPTADAPIHEFATRPAYRALTPEDVMAMTPQQYSLMFSRSPIKRARLDGLRRNAAAL